MPRALTVNDVARILGWNSMSVYGKAQRGEIPCWKEGYALRFDRDEILEWKTRNDELQGKERTESQKRWAEQLAAQRKLQESRRRTNSTPTPDPTPPQRVAAEQEKIDRRKTSRH